MIGICRVNLGVRVDQGVWTGWDSSQVVARSPSTQKLKSASSFRKARSSRVRAADSRTTTIAQLSPQLTGRCIQCLNARPPGLLQRSRWPSFAVGVADPASAKAARNTVVGWGASGAGETQAPPPGTSGFSAISAGMDFSLGLKFNGTVVGWGDNTAGEINIPKPGAHRRYTRHRSRRSPRVCGI